MPATKRRKKTPHKAATHNIDTVIAEFANISKTRMQGIEKQDAALLNETNEDDDFYLMIARKSRSLSRESQYWLQDRVWNLWIEARNLERSGGACNQCSVLKHLLPVLPSKTGVNAVHFRSWAHWCLEQ